MIVRLALAAALDLAPPAASGASAPEGPAPPPVSPEAARPAAAEPPDLVTPPPSGPGNPSADPSRPTSSAPPSTPPTSASAPAPDNTPRIPSPRGLPQSLETGPDGQVLEDRFGGLGLVRQRDGTLMYVDSGKRFTAVFNPDGSVRFGDRWNRDQHGEKMPGSRAALRQINMAGLGVAGPSEWLVKLQDLLGGPEQHASAKREFLDRTREVRIQMAIAWTRDNIGQRLGALERELFDLWSGPGDPASKRALIFQRWDECDEAYRVEFAGQIPEEAASQIDRERVEAAERARRIIEDFVRRQLPRSGPHAFNKRELDGLNRGRVSRQVFRPYDPPVNKRTP